MLTEEECENHSGNVGMYIFMNDFVHDFIFNVSSRGTGGGSDSQAHSNMCT